MIELPWVDFQVVVAGYGVDLNFLLWGSLETEHNGGWNRQFDSELMKTDRGGCLHVFWKAAKHWTGGLVTACFIVCLLTTMLWCSMRSFSTPAPYSSLSRHMMRVFFPAPDGPYTNRCGKSPHWTFETKIENDAINFTTTPDKQSGGLRCIFFKVPATLHFFLKLCVVISL